MNKNERQNPPYKLVLSVEEFTKAMGVSRPKAYEIIRRKDFNGAFKFGKRTLISAEKAREWVESQVESGKSV